MGGGKLGIYEWNLHKIENVKILSKIMSVKAQQLR